MATKNITKRSVSINPKLYKYIWTFLDNAIAGNGAQCEPPVIDDAVAIKKLLEAAKANSAQS